MLRSDASREAAPPFAGSRRRGRAEEVVKELKEEARLDASYAERQYALALLYRCSDQ
jgi:hypothetical protein